MIEAKNLIKKYDEYTAVNNVSFSINPGEVVGLLGPNGAGKTTIMKMLTCYHYPTSGDLDIFGQSVYKNEVGIKSSLGYLPENAPLYPEFQVREYLEFIADARIGKGKTPSGLSAKAAVDKAIKDCALEEKEFSLIEKLSKGYRQRVGLAQAILHEPKFLILDEPTTGLDPNQILEIRKLIRELREGRTIILSTHILQEVEAVCDRVFIINKGEIRAQGTTQEIADELRGETVFELIATGDKAIVQKALAQLKIKKIEEDSLLLTQIGEIPASAGKVFGLRLRVMVDKTNTFEIRSQVVKMTQDTGATVLHFVSRLASLEDLFVQITKEAKNG